ncbi:MAG: MFS transporter [Planctomycetota bacterium]
MPPPPLETGSPLPAPPPSPVPLSAPRLISRRAIASWVLYDLANTVFSMGVVSIYFSLWIADHVGRERADSVYGIVTSISMGLIFVVSPLLGAMTDRAPRRMPFLVVSTMICVGLTALLGRGGYGLSIPLFIVANVAYQAGLQFYDALLPEVSTEANRGKIGGIGIGVGYFGSYLAVSLGLIWGTQDKPFLFLVIAVTFLAFAIPCMVFVRERGNPHPRPIDWEMVRHSTRETWRTLRSTREYPGLLRFLIGRVFYTDAINTVIAFMTLFVVNVALHSGVSKAEGERQAQWIMMCAVSFAVAGGFLWGWLTDRLGPKRTLQIVLKSWMLLFSGTALVALLGLPLAAMYVIAAGAGFSLGGIWAADRPFMLRLAPAHRVGEFYGLYGMVGRFSAITGPALWTLTFSSATALGCKPLTAQGFSVLVLLAMVVVSYRILRGVSDTPRDLTNREAAEAASPRFL